MLKSILSLILTLNLVATTLINIQHLNPLYWHHHRILPVSFNSEQKISVGGGTGVEAVAHEGFSNSNYNFAKKIPLGNFGFILPLFKRILTTENLATKESIHTQDILVTKKLIHTTAHPKHVVKDAENVHILDFTSKGIKSISELNLTPMTNLKSLILTKNQFKIFKFSDLPFLPHLELIDLSFNPLAEIEWSKFRQFVPKLDIINITGSKIPDDKIAEYTRESNCTLVNNKLERKSAILFPETET